MKTFILSIALAVILAACNSNHSAGQQSDLVSSYLQIRDALVADNTSKAKVAASEMRSQLSSSTLIDKTQAAKMDSALAGLASTADLETQRAYFSQLSNQLISLAKNNSLSKNALYVDYCPMALNNKGAVWLNNKEEIRNPYLGTRMPGCGTIQDTISK